jgi:hypothetical protein
MGRRGRKRQLEMEARYWQLVQSGVGMVAACRQMIQGEATSSGANGLSRSAG